VCVWALALAHARARSLSVYFSFTHTQGEIIISLRERLCMNHAVLQHTHTHSLTLEIDLYWWANSYNLAVGLPFYQSRCPAVRALQSHARPYHGQLSFARFRVFGTEPCSRPVCVRERVLLCVVYVILRLELWHKIPIRTYTWICKNYARGGLGSLVAYDGNAYISTSMYTPAHTYISLCEVHCVDGYIHMYACVCVCENIYVHMSERA